MGKRLEKLTKARAKKRQAKAEAMKSPGHKSRYAQRPGGGGWRNCTEAELIEATRERLGATDIVPGRGPAETT